MQIFKGKIFSIKNKKTVLVLIKKRIKNNLYNKSYNKFKKVYINDEFGLCLKNSIVVFAETRPYSKKKSCKIIKII